jgi:3D (Asp-Asp-Asp) domain-containing protein
LAEKHWYRIGWALLPAAGLTCAPADRPADRAPPAPAPAPSVVIAHRPEPMPTPDVPAGPKSLGDFKMTFYYLIVEGEPGPRSPVARPAPLVATAGSVGSAGSDGSDGADGTDAGVGSAGPAGSAGSDGSDGSGTLASAAPEPQVDPDQQMVPIYEGGTCNVLAEVTYAYFTELVMQGSGQLKDGRIINVFGQCTCPQTSSCFQVAKASKWGLAGTGWPLSPYRTVAVDPKVVPLGSLLYIPALDGLRMPGPPPIGGFVHDGCVVADDTGGAVHGKQVDLFVGRRAYWLGLARRGGSHEWARHVQIFDGTGRCTRQGGKVSRSAAGSI